MTEQGTAVGAVSSDGLVISAVLRSDVGLVRSENQDYATFTTPREEAGRRPGGRLLIVADGMGGHRGGATASRLAVETVKAEYLSAATDDIATALRDALRKANALIFNEAQANPDLRGMGTTTSALVVRGTGAWFGHVGDSRIYLVRGDELRQLTQDHSLVATMVREGLITSEEAEHHPRRNVLQRSMGVGDDVDVDVRGPLAIHQADTFVLCSDGLHGVVKDAEILEVAKWPIDKAADEFVRRAISRGAPDNVTVIVARVEKVSDVDDTLVDRPRRRPTREMLDETLRDTEPMPALKEPVAGPGTTDFPPPEPAAAAPVAEPLAPPVAAPAAAAAPAPAPAVVPKKRGGAVLKWALLFVLVLGAAGGWLFWSQVKALDRPAAHSTR